MILIGIFQRSSYINIHLLLNELNATANPIEWVVWMFSKSTLQLSEIDTWPKTLKQNVGTS